MADVELFYSHEKLEAVIENMKENNPRGVFLAKEVIQPIVSWCGRTKLYRFGLRNGFHFISKDESEFRDLFNERILESSSEGLQELCPTKHEQHTMIDTWSIYFAHGVTGGNSYEIINLELSCSLVSAVATVLLKLPFKHALV
jgi:hypothetical protein